MSRASQLPKYFFETDFHSAAKQVKIQGTGTTVAGIKQEKLREYIIGLPSFAEQNRIVAKIDELMSLCDQLKAHLSDAQTTQLHLTDAMVEQAIENTVN